MTIEDVNPFTTPDTISADLSTTYAFAFKIKEGEESSVLAQVTATDGTITYPVYNTDYSIVRATDPLVGGTAQFLTAQPTGAKVVWYRKTPRNQGTTLPNQGAYKAEVVEGMIDKVAALGQELVRDVDLALGYPLGTDLDNYSAVLPVPVADKYIVGKSVGGKLTYVESTLSESNLTTYHTAALAAQTAAEAAKTGAETAETNAETAETNAETAQTAAEAAQALAETARDAAIAASETTAWGYTFDDGTADADPGTAKLRFNNATITSATELYISQSADEGDIGAVIDLWDASTSASKATLKFINPTAKTNWVECEITGAATDDGTYWSIPIGNVVQGGSFSDDDTLLLGVQRHGDAGTGAVDSFNGRTGVVLPAANDYDISEIENAGALASLDTVGTSEMDANAVTLAEMEHGTAGDILYYGVSGAPTRLAKGSADQVLKQGANYPEWADESGGTWEHIVTTDVTSDVSSVDFTGLSAYRYLRVTFSLIPATDAQHFWLRMSDDNGSTFEAGASDYGWAAHYASSGDHGSPSDNSDNQIRLGVGVGSSANERVSGQILFTEFNQTEYTHTVGVMSTIHNNSNRYSITNFGTRNSTTAQDAFRLMFASGNVEAGSHVVLEGIQG